MSKVTNEWLNPVWHRMLYSCTRMAAVGVKGLTPAIDMAWQCPGITLCPQAQHISSRVHSRERRYVRLHNSWPETLAGEVCFGEVVQWRQWRRWSWEQHVPRPIHHAHGALRYQHVSLKLSLTLILITRSQAVARIVDRTASQQTI